MSVSTPTMTFEAGRLRALEPDGWPALRRALMACTVIRDTTGTLPTAAIDEWWRVYYNPAWFARLTAVGASGVAVHEVWHPLRFHPWRARAVGVSREHHDLWNAVADAEIHEGNDRLVKVLANLPAPDGAGTCSPVTRASFDPPLSEGGVAERWFWEVLRRPSTVKDAHGGWRPRMAGQLPAPSGSGATGLPGPWELPGPHDGGPPGLDRTRTDIVRRATAAAVQREASASRGVGDGGMVRWANEVIEPKVDWRVRVQGAFQNSVAAVYGGSRWTYRFPGRRRPPDPRLISPGRLSSVPDVGVIIDTSGSMSDRMLSLCRQEVTGMLAALGRRARVNVYACDSRAHAAQEVYTGADVKLYGGGGTDMIEAFKLASRDVAERRKQFDLLVIMTDGHTPWPKQTDLTAPLITVLMGTGSHPAWLYTPPNQVVRVDENDLAG